MIDERSHDQRARDTQLAWIIVCGCGVISLTLIGLLAAALITNAITELTKFDDERARRAERFRINYDGAGPFRASSSDPIPVGLARPVGNPARWLNRSTRPDGPLARGERGVVKVMLLVGADGVPSGCRITLSSGYTGLDAGTCQSLLWASERFRAREAGRTRFGARRGTPLDIAADRLEPGQIAPVSDRIDVQSASITKRGRRTQVRRPRQFTSRDQA